MAVDYFSIRGGLEINTDLTSGAVVVQILTGSDDPTTGAGLEANEGSLYLRDNGIHYRKVGPADTDWEAEPDLSSISGDLAALSAAIDINSGDIINLSGAIDNNTGDIIDIQNDLTSGFVTTTTNQTVSGQKTFVDDMLINADLTVLGTTTTLSAQDLEIADNTILLNSGETGAGVTLGTAGIEIDRGTENNVQLRWNETTDTWQVTFDGITYYNILTEADGIDVDLATLSAAIDNNTTNINTVSGDVLVIETTIGTLSAGNYIAGTEIASDLVALDDNLATVSGDLDTLENIVGAPLSAGNVITGTSVADDLVALDNFVSTLSIPITGGANGVTSPTVIDTVPLAQYDVASWEVFAQLDSDTTRRRALRVNAMHSGAGAIDVDNYSLLSIGASWAGVDVDVVISGSFMALVVDSTPAASFKSIRVFNL
jgi:hypothetical protein